MLEKPSREQFYSKRAKKARKHAQQKREAAERKRKEYALLPANFNKENEDAS